jgi:hypothetical protein
VPMNAEESTSRRVRGKCVWWLSGQCTGGRACTCLPWPRPGAEGLIAESSGGEPPATMPILPDNS